jgi:hypothetical protein
MPILKVIRQHDYVLQPAEIETLVGAFEDVLAALHLERREDPATLEVAKGLLEIWRGGERDRPRLCQLTLAAFRK